MNPDKHTEETLDPSDWNRIESLGSLMVSDMLHHLQTLRDRPVWQQPSEEAKNHFHAPVPMEGEAIEQVYEEFKKNILPFPTGNIHPRFWGWVMGNGSASAMLADMLASGININ